MTAPIRIHLAEYDPEWARKFEHEANRIGTVLGARALKIEHVGSTSIPGLVAKPIIDIVLVVLESAKEDQYATALEKAVYQLSIREPDWYEHRMFKSPDGDVNLHVFSVGCPEIERMLSFRDWLRISESDRKLYAQRKHDLAQSDWKCVQHYADAKSAIVNEILSRTCSAAFPRVSSLDG